jgi:hypothetical protein
VGSENQGRIVVGRYSLHKESNNGLRLIGLAAALNMVIGTTFPYKNVHLATWRTPEGKTENQIIS